MFLEQFDIDKYNGIEGIDRKIIEEDIDSHYKDYQLYNFSIQLTTSCRQGCSGCYQPHIKESINPDTIINLLNEFIEERNRYRIFKPFKITFFGGEPLYEYETIFKIIEHINKIRPYGFRQFVMPTSGIIKRTDPKLDGYDFLSIVQGMIDRTDYNISISVSHDGINNEVTRNVPPEIINRIIKKLIKKEIKNNRIITSSTISTVIPQNINEDYFINNYDYLMEHTGKPCNFKIPYIINKNSNLYTDPKIFKVAVKKFINKLERENIKGNKIPHLFSEVIDLLKTNHKFNWCGAGVHSNLILPSGRKVDCDIIKDYKGLELKDKMDKHCNSCEIKDYCKRPCLVTMVNDLEHFNVQCTLRKILVNELKKYLLNTLNIHK